MLVEDVVIDFPIVHHGVEIAGIVIDEIHDIGAPGLSYNFSVLGLQMANPSCRPILADTLSVFFTTLLKG